MNQHSPAQRAMHASLVMVWLGTAAVSALDHLGLSGLDHEGARLLADLCIGIALLLRPGRASYLAALALMTAMTLIGTALQPALWLHPLGPLLKNLPLAAMLWFLLQPENAHPQSSKLEP